jgi:hypothetical protein
MDITVNKAKNGAVDALLILAGVAAGKFTIGFAKKFMPPVVAPALGLAGLIPHFSNSSDEEKAFGNGFMVAGVLDGFAVLAEKVPFLKSFSSFVPKLAGPEDEVQYIDQNTFDQQSVLGIGEPGPGFLLSQDNLVI